MTVETKELPNEPIIIFHVRLPHKPEEDVPFSLQTSANFKKKIGGHIYRVVDLSNFNLSFSEAMMGMAAERGAEGGVNDPDVSSLYVGFGEWVSFGVQAFQEQSQYGKTNILHICSSVDEAIAVARAEIAKNKK